MHIYFGCFGTSATECHAMIRNHHVAAWFGSFSAMLEGTGVVVVCAKKRPVPDTKYGRRMYYCINNILQQQQCERQLYHADAMVRFLSAPPGTT